MIWDIDYVFAWYTKIKIKISKLHISDMFVHYSTDSGLPYYSVLLRRTAAVIDPFSYDFIIGEILGYTSQKITISE